MKKIISVFHLLFFSFIASSQTVDFTCQSDNGLFCNPATIQFTQTSTGGATGFIWNLGNGLKSTSPSVVTSYTNAGTYKVKLTAIFPQGAIEITKNVVITPTISPKINVDRDYICQPGVINFTASGNGNINTYDWDFGDSTGIITTPDKIIDHNYAAYGTYIVVLKATDGGGCFGYDTMQVEVTKLPLTASATPSSGCIPAVVSFTSTVTAPSNSSVTTYLWDFGDGSTSSDTGSTTHTYPAVGSFLPTLTVTTAEGCSNTFSFPAEAFGTPPVNLQAYAVDTLVCGSETLVFIAKATNANSYMWDFGDGTIETITDTIAKHKYRSLGTKKVSVTPLQNNCPGALLNFNIKVRGVIALFNNANTCSDKKTYFFNNISMGNKSSVLWDFGDGSISDSINLFHTFPTSGAYTVSLTVNDSITGCSDTLKRTVYTADPILINNDSLICKNSNTTFSLANNYESNSATYSWRVLGKTVTSGTTPEVTTRANTLGTFPNYVIISLGNTARNCPDTIFLNHPILVRGPNLDFTMPASVCFTDTVNILNNSKPFVASDSVLLWYWNYGASRLNDTIYQPEPLVYTSPRTYLIKLVGIDINGCKDSLTHRVAVNPLPFLQVFPGTDTLCLGQSDTLLAFHTDDILWSPASGLSCATCDTVLANPTVTTQYTISTTTAFNCSITDSILVKVIPPFTAVASANQYICPGEEVTLDADPKNKVVLWSPSASLSATNIYNPVARPTQTTTYTATLTDSTGCFSSTADVTVFINTPPTVDAGPDRILQFNAPFTLAPSYSNNIRSYLWTPSTLLNCSTCASPAGIASTSQTYTISVVSDSGCVASDSINIALECKESNILMPKAFTPNNDNLNDYYYPITRGIKTIVRFIIYNREGQVLFEGHNFAPNIKTLGWNGEFKGAKQGSKAYVYVMEAVCEAGQTLNKSGSFLIVR